MEPSVAVGHLRFVGRAQELRTLHRLFHDEDTRLVTLLGAPGAGKTRLACRFGEEWANDFRRASFCDLGLCRTVEEFVGSVAAACGLKLLSVTNSALEIDQLGRLLSDCGELLVILDNFDQLIDHAAPTIGRWLELSPNIRWLLTSRARVHLDCEIELELSGLSDADAATLFVERARFSRPGFELGPVDREALATLLERLDFMPLAIELAAARANVLSPAQMLSLIGRRFELLRATSGSASSRHTALQTTIDWSWQMLTGAQQRLLSRCSVFHGSFSLEAARALADQSSELTVLDDLQSLHERSLLRVLPSSEASDELCFALYESIRDFAAARLVEFGDADEMARRHADYYLAAGDALLRDLIGNPPQDSLNVAERQLANYSAVRARFLTIDSTRALCANLILAAVLCRRASFESLRALLDETVALAGHDVAPHLRASALCARGRMLGLRGFWQLAAQDFEQALSCIEESAAESSSSDEGRVTYLLNTAYCNLGEAARARPHAERTLELARKTAERELSALSRYALGKLHLLQEQLVEAGKAFLDAATLFDTVPGHRGKALSLGNLSITRVRQGQLEEAHPHLLQALQLFRERDDQVLEDKLLCELAQILAGQGRYEEADQLFAHVVDRALQHGDRELLSRVSLGRATAALHAGNPSLARQHLAAALAAAELIQCPPLESRIAKVLATAQSVQSNAPPQNLCVATDCYWFQFGGPRVELSRRPSLRRMMVALVQARLVTPGRPLSVEQLFAAGWPGERARLESCTQRVYTAVYSLRHFGLGQVLLSRDGGYLLDPAVELKTLERNAQAS